MLRTPLDLSRVLIERIDAGHWPEGTRLPSERELATEFSLARNTVRQAMQKLEAEGRVERHVGRGTFVLSGGTDAAAELWHGFAGYAPADVLEARIMLEPQATALAAATASTAELDQLQDLLESATAAKGPAEFEAWDARLHHAIYCATRNDVLRGFSEAMGAARTRPGWHRLKQRAVDEARRLEYDRQHADIIAALLDRDPERAKHAAFAHASTVARHMLEEQP